MIGTLAKQAQGNIARWAIVHLRHRPSVIQKLQNSKKMYMALGRSFATWARVICAGFVQARLAICLVPRASTE